MAISSPNATLDASPLVTIGPDTTNKITAAMAGGMITLILENDGD